MSARLSAVAAACAVLAALPVRAQDTHLEFRGRPRLLECQGAPCFRMDVQALDAQGQPVDVPAGASWEVFLGDEKLPNVFVQNLRSAAPAAPAAGGRGASQSGSTSGAARADVARVTFILFDTSGSMNEKLQGRETKFAVARRQLDRLFESFREGVDRMAIAPFDSQRVVAKIHGATLESTRAGLRRQVDALKPNPRGNTALFSAAREALQVLKPYSQKGDQVSLVVFTDGKNDVGHASDDPDLLAGEEGLRAVVQAAKDVGVTINAIGYGAAGVSFDEAALKTMAYPNPSNYFNASDEARLIDIFKDITKRAQSAVRLLAGPLAQRRDQLSGQSLVLRVKNGDLAGDAPAWEGTPIGTPPIEGVLTASERAAVLIWPLGQVDRGPWSPVIIRMIVLFTYAGLLALLWFGLPRLLWPERYIPKPAVHAAAARPAARPQAGRPAPAGRAGPVQRPEVTIASGRPAGRSGGPSPRGSGSPAEPPPPARPRPAAPRPREPMGAREATDATVFIPPAKKPGRDS
jgi:Ca-activated chloride channel family protein